MPAIQTTYLARHGVAVEGQIADSVLNNIVTRYCETVAGIGFGKAVSRGAKDKGVVIGGTLAGFEGISVQDRTLVHTSPDLYLPARQHGRAQHGHDLGGGRRGRE
jgi:hypothetical protein